MPRKPPGGEKQPQKDPPPDTSKPPAVVSSSSSPPGRQPTTATAGDSGGGSSGMGARWSGGGAAGSSGKAPSTASASSTHTASTVPADGADAKSKSSSTLPAKTSGVAGFLRRKPSNKTAGSSSADRRRSDPVQDSGASGEAKKTAKKGGALRTSLFKRKGKETAEAKSEPVAEKGRPPVAPRSASPPKPAARPASRTSAGSGEAPAPKRKTPSPAARKAPSPAQRKSPSPTDAVRKSPTTPKAASVPPQASAAAAPGDKPADGGAGRGRGSKALTPAEKEALKKQWFTEGQPPHQSATRSSARLTAASRPRDPARSEVSSEPPAKVSRVSNAAAKFGPTVKTTPKPRPGSPKKGGQAEKSSVGADKYDTSVKKSDTGAKKQAAAVEKMVTSVSKSTVAAEKPCAGGEKPTTAAAKPSDHTGMGDFMDAMSGFKGVDSSNSVTTGDSAGAGATKPGAGDVKAGDKGAGAVGKDSGMDADMKDLMGAMSGFNPDGSQSGAQKDVKQKSAGDSNPSGKDADSKQANAADTVVKDKHDGGKSNAKKDTPDLKSAKHEATDNKTAKADSPKKDDSAAGASAPAAAADLVSKVVDKAVLIASDDSAEPDADKKSIRKLGDEDTGELGLGGISQKDRQERSERPKSPKSEEADLDFLSSVIDTMPKAPPRKGTSPKAQKKPDKDEGLGDLMELAMGIDMSAKPKSETESTSAAQPKLPSSGDMDKFLDFMSMEPAKPASAGPLKEVSEPPIVEKKWGTGYDDDEKMNELRTKKRDFNAPAQEPDWDIDDLLVDAVPVTSKKDEAKAKDSDKGKDNKTSVKAGFSAFDDFMADSMSTAEKSSAGDGDKHKHKHSDKDEKNDDKSATSGKTKGEAKKSDDKGFSGFDDFLSDSLSTAVSPPVPSAPKIDEDVVAAPKQVARVDTAPKTAMKEETIEAPKQMNSVSSAPKQTPVDDEIISAVAASQTTATPAGKPKSKHVEKEGNTRGSVPDHGHGVRDLLYDDHDKTGRKSKDHKPSDSLSRPVALLDDLIQPAKASSTSSAPRKEETVVAQAAVSTESGAKPSGKKVADKHIEKEGNTRGSVPDHGHGVRDVLYDDSDKTGLVKSGAISKGDDKPRGPELLDDLVVPKKASSSHSAPHEAVATAVVASQSHAKPAAGKHEEKAHHSEKAHSTETKHDKKDSDNKVGDKHIEKHGDTRGSCPDHGHGVRDVLYDDSDKTGRGSSKKGKADDKRREPAVLDDLVLPKKASVSHAEPHSHEKVVSAEVSHQSHAKPGASHKEGESDSKIGDKYIEKHGDTRGSCPDHGHGLRDVLYDDKDKTGRGDSKKGKAEDKHREPAVLDALVLPKKATVSHADPLSHEKVVSAEVSHQSHAKPSQKHEEKAHTSSKAHSTEASHKEGDGGSKVCDKHIEKHGDTRGSCPDHGHGVRDVLYDDSDKTGRAKKDSTPKDNNKHREPAVLDDLVVPRQASSVASAAPSQQRSPSPDTDGDDDEHVSAATAHSTESSAPTPTKSKRKRNRNRNKNKSKSVEKEGNTRGSVPDHGHGARDVLYDDSDKTGQKKPTDTHSKEPRQPADLDELIRQAQASGTSSAPSSSSHHDAAAGHGAPVVAATAAAVHGTPPGSGGKKAKPKKNLSLGGMTDPSPDSDSDGEELRRLIASTEALQHQLHACGVLADNQQAEAAQAAAGKELEQLEDQLHRKEAKLAAAGKQTPELQTAKDQLKKAKQQLTEGKAKK